MNYDNFILLNGMSKFNPQINCIGITSKILRVLNLNLRNIKWMMMEKLMKLKANIHLE